MHPERSVGTTQFRHGSGVLNPREHTVGLPPPYIEVAAFDDQGQFGLLEQRRKARKISSGIASHALSSHLRSVAIANNWPTQIRSLIGRMGCADVVVGAGLRPVAAQVYGRSMAGTCGALRRSSAVMSLAGRSLPGWPGM